MGCAGCLGLIAVAALMPVILSLLKLGGHLLALVGMSVIIPIDYLAGAFRIVGVGDPAAGWLIIGCLAGAAIGVAKGLKSAGRRSDTWKVFAGAGTLAAMLLLMSFLSQPSGRGGSNLNGIVTPSPTVTPKRAASSPAAPEGMVHVPGGDFMMGDDNGDELQRPAHKVTVRPFYIDKYEVTCEEYEKFVLETRTRPPSNWVNGRCQPERRRWPVTGVDWASARAYAARLNKRLPSEAEWEFAARGPAGLRYPWGNEWKPNAANADNTSRGHMTNVGEYADGASPFGAYDMVGNAWEWTADDLTSYDGGALPERLATGEKVNRGKVIRGGYWDSLKGEDATTTFRMGYAPQGKDYSNTGFRCVQDVTNSDKSR